MQVKEAIEQYWAVRGPDLADNTIADYGRTFDRLEAFLADKDIADLDQVTPRDVQEFLAELAGMGLGKKTRANAWTALSSLWSWAEGALGVSHIMRNVPMPRYVRNQPDPYSEEDVRALLGACDQTAPWDGRYRGIRSRRATADRDRAIMLVLLDTGMRASELCSLEVGDYDRKTGRLVIREGKGGKARQVFLGYTSRQALLKYLRRRSDMHPREPLFATSSGSPLDRSNLLNMIRAAGRRAGVQPANVHRFRHTCAVTLLRNGANMFVVKEILGHVDMQTVQMYVKLAEIDLQAAMRAASPADHWRL